MSQQIEFLQNLIATVRTGDKPSLALLRQICQKAATHAPMRDLASMGECLVRIGEEATRTEIGRN